MSLVIFTASIACWLLIIPSFGTSSSISKFEELYSPKKFFAIWMFMMIASFCAQIFAIKWALKTKWSDFKLVAEPLADITSSNPTELPK